MTSKEKYEWYKAHGICVVCGQEDAVKGKTRCLYCASKKAGKAYDKYHSMGADEKEELLRKKKERSKSLREHRKRNGLCVKCGKPAYQGYSLCYEHMLQSRRYQRAWNEKHRKKGYAELGLCRICGKEVVPGKKFCKEHLEQYRDNMRRNGEKKSGRTP